MWRGFRNAQPAMIARTTIAPNGPEFSRLVYGTWRILDDPACANAKHFLERLHACLDLGITTLDTAEIYGVYQVEEFIGEALRHEPELRRRFEFVTKCGIYIPCEFHPERKVAHYNATARRIVKSAEKSLRLLGVERIDLLLVHRPDWLTSADETAAGLNQLLREGKIRAAGVSNYTVDQFELLNSRMDQPLVTNQVEMSLLHMDALYDGTTDQCQRLRIHPMAWSPLYKGKLMDPTDEASGRIHAYTREIAEKYGNASVDQLAYAWIMAHPSGPLPIIGTNRLDRLKATAAAAEIELEREDWYGLWQAAKGHGVP